MPTTMTQMRRTISTIVATRHPRPTPALHTHTYTHMHTTNQHASSLPPPPSFLPLSLLLFPFSLPRPPSLFSFFPLLSLLPPTSRLLFLLHPSFIPCYLLLLILSLFSISFPVFHPNSTAVKDCYQSGQLLPLKVQTHQS